MLFASSWGLVSKFTTQHRTKWIFGLFTEKYQANLLKQFRIPKIFQYLYVW